MEWKIIATYYLPEDYVKKKKALQKWLDKDMHRIATLSDGNNTGRFKNTENRLVVP